MVKVKLNNLEMYNAVNKKRTIKVLKQSGRIKDFERDFSRKGSLPGKRVSRSGKVYWETRVNRTDAGNSRIWNALKNKARINERLENLKDRYTMPW